MYPNVIKNQISEFHPQKREVSIDFEFRPGPDQDWSNPELTIAGLCSGGEPHSAFWDDRAERKIRELEEKEPVWVGHNALTVEREITGKIVGHEIPVERVEDTMLRHYLCNAELCKGVVKSSGEDEDEDQKEKGMGFNDLWSMASLYTDLPQWKQCRGTSCSGPCPTHDPLGYNGTDCVAPDVALPRLKEEMKQKRIPEGLYNNLKKLTLMCHAMSEKGIKVDRNLVAQLEEEFNGRKNKIFPSRWQAKIGKKGQELKTKELVWDAPFNPRSPKAVLDYFSQAGIPLGSTEKEDIQTALRNLNGNEDPEAVKWLENLHDYKDAGKGLKAWTSDRYFDKWSMVHSRVITTGSSLGRLSSSNPNWMNVPVRGWGAEVRKAVVPRDPSLQIVEADKSQGELRICLWLSGLEDIPPGDAFKWLVEEGNGIFEKAAEIVGGGQSPRQLAKSVTHGTNYLEGLRLLSGKDLDSSYTKRQIDAGALDVHRDWEYCGKVVAFTGSNLANRLFRSTTYEARKKALEILKAYFGKFSSVRQWHKKVSAQAEKGFVQSLSGRYLTLVGTPEDKLKIAAAFFGQGGLADDVQEKMIWYWESGAPIPMLQVHDSLTWELPKDTTKEQLVQHFSIFAQPSKVLPGFRCPIKISQGPNWGELTEVAKI